ncbi:unnamed protein product [Lampetra planeri]
MDQVGQDSLILKKMLLLAQELQVVLPAMEDDGLTSLQVARCLEAHLNICRHSGVVASMGPAAEEEGALAGEQHLQVGVLRPTAKWRRSRKINCAGETDRGELSLDRGTAPFSASSAGCWLHVSVGDIAPKVGGATDFAARFGTLREGAAIIRSFFG